MQVGFIRLIRVWRRCLNKTVDAMGSSVSKVVAIISVGEDREKSLREYAGKLCAVTNQYIYRIQAHLSAAAVRIEPTAADEGGGPATADGSDVDAKSAELLGATSAALGGGAVPEGAHRWRPCGIRARFLCTGTHPDGACSV